MKLLFTIQYNGQLNKMACMSDNNNNRVELCALVKHISICCDHYICGQYDPNFAFALSHLLFASSLPNEKIIRYCGDKTVRHRKAAGPLFTTSYYQMHYSYVKTEKTPFDYPNRGV